MTDPFVEEVLERLTPAGTVRARGMFGGSGLYLEGVFFGLIADGALYFRVDDASRGAYESAGSHAFQPFPDKPPMGTYWSVPDRVQSDRGELRSWTLRALEAARARDAGKRKQAASKRTGSRKNGSNKSGSKKTGSKKAGSKRATKIPGIGPVSSRWLADIGVKDMAGLERRGSVAIFLAVRARGQRASANLLYALEGALLGLRWDRLPDVVRANLRERAGL